MVTRPFSSPHHSASVVSLIGGGQNAKPGEVSLAHNGVLFLDEIGTLPSDTQALLLKGKLARLRRETEKESP